MWWETNQWHGLKALLFRKCSTVCSDCFVDWLKLPHDAYNWSDVTILRSTQTKLIKFRQVSLWQNLHEPLMPQKHLESRAPPFGVSGNRQQIRYFAQFGPSKQLFRLHHQRVNFSRLFLMVAYDILPQNRIYGFLRQKVRFSAFYWCTFPCLYYLQLVLQQCSITFEKALEYAYATLYAHRYPHTSYPWAAKSRKRSAYIQIHCLQIREQNNPYNALNLRFNCQKRAQIFLTVAFSSMMFVNLRG